MSVSIKCDIGDQQDSQGWLPFGWPSVTILISAEQNHKVGRVLMQDQVH